MAAMNSDLSGLAGRPSNAQPYPLENAMYGAGPGLIRTGLGAYGEKFLGSSSEFMQSNITQYLSDPQYYFQVNSQYVRNKLKVILFPFFHRGHWTRITEPVGGRLSYKPPIQDINAPDLYIPLMAFGTYIVIAGYALGVLGRFTPEALTLQFTRGLVGWFLQVILIKGLLYSLGSGEAPLLRRRGVRWIWICWHISCNAGPHLLELLVLFHHAMVLSLHWRVPREDHEEGSPGWTKEL